MLRRAWAWSLSNPASSISIAIAIISAVIAYFAWWQPEWKAAADSNLRTVVKDELEAGLKSRHLDEVPGDIKELRAQLKEMDSFLQILTVKELRQQATLSKPAFEQQIPAVAVTVSAARMVHTEASPQVVAGIAHRFA
jgi:hypothetical protein